MLTETILVTGATGQQGGTTARHLLADGFQVRALVRNAKSASALELAHAGAELVIGDMDDRESLDSAIRGAYGVFSIQPSLIPPTFSENELQRGLNVVDAAQAAGIQHLVYASVGSANRRTGIPHWEIKWQITRAISRATGRTLPMASADKSSFGAEGVEEPISFCGWQADIPALRARYPPLMNFDTWLTQGGAAMIEKLFIDRSPT